MSKGGSHGGGGSKGGGSKGGCGGGKAMAVRVCRLAEHNGNPSGGGRENAPPSK